MRTIALLLAIAVTGTPAAAQTMYKWVDKDGKTHYTDSPPPDDAKKLAPPKGSAPTGSTAPGPSKGGGGDEKGRTQRSFKPEEQAAIQVMCGIAVLEAFACQMELNRWCSMDELVKGVNGDKSKAFEGDPRRDPNYDYRVNTGGGGIQISAVPKKAGLAGFFNQGEGTQYNLNGAAGKSDPMVAGGTSCGNQTK